MLKQVLKYGRQGCIIENVCSDKAYNMRIQEDTMKRQDTSYRANMGQIWGKTAQFCIFSSFSSMLLMKPLMLDFRSCPVHGFIGSPTR